MIETLVLLAEGFEEVEALTVVDLLRRAGIGCEMISLQDDLAVRGSHGIVVRADGTLAGTDAASYDGLILPGGRRGTERLLADGRVTALLQSFHSAGKLTAAICAAPTVLAAAGLLHGKQAVCYPGMEDGLLDAEHVSAAVVRDGDVITSRSMGTSVPFALALIAYYLGDAAAQKQAEAIVYKGEK